MPQRFRPIKLVVSPDHFIKDHTSANQIGTYRRCHRFWGFRNLYGLKPEKKDPWLDLGTQLHWQMRCYARGYQLDTRLEAGRRALAGLHLLPDPRTVEFVEDEAEMRIDTRVLLPRVEPLIVLGARDLTLGWRVAPGSVLWTLWDYKTTRGDRSGKITGTKDPWAFVLTPEELRDDVAGNLYAWDIMWNRGVTEVPARWIYFLTDEEKHPDANHTDYTYKLAEVVPRCQEYLTVGEEHRYLARQYARQPFDVNELAPNFNSCDDFGGCPYRAESGGPCKNIRTLGEMMHDTAYV